jgi:hypothetical protein
MSLLRRRAQGNRPSNWNPDDFDVLDDGREVGRIYRVNAATEIWWWGVSFQLTGRKSYGRVDTREQAMAAFKAEYERRRAEQPRS